MENHRLFRSFVSERSGTRNPLLNRGSTADSTSREVVGSRQLRIERTARGSRAGVPGDAIVLESVEFTGTPSLRKPNPFVGLRSPKPPVFSPNQACVGDMGTLRRSGF